MEPAYNKSLETDQNTDTGHNIPNSDKLNNNRMLYSQLNQIESSFKYRAPQAGSTSFMNFRGFSIRWLYNVCCILFTVVVLMHVFDKVANSKCPKSESEIETDAEFEKLESDIAENIILTDDIEDENNDIESYENEAKISAKHSSPDSSSSNSEKWIIIAFSDITYIEVAKIWYNQLTKLGYSEHKIAALDHETYVTLKEDSYRVMLTNEKLERSGRVLKLIWKIRLMTLNSLLKEGYNVMISDVDSIWLNYRDLNSLPPMFDTFHSYGTTFPSDTFKKWKFVICGCIGAYRSTPNTGGMTIKKA